MKVSQRHYATVALVMGCAMLLWFSWIKSGQLLLSLALMFACTLAAGFLQRPAVGEAVAAEPAESERGPSNVSPFVTLLFGAVALWSALGAQRAFKAEAWGACALWLALGAAAWRFCLPLSLPKISKGMSAALLLLAIAAGALFRLHLAGEVPYGLAMVDEPRLLLKVREFASGIRETFAVSPGMLADGAIPFYLQALGIKLFGDSLTGYRMSGILIGIFLVWVLYQLGKEKEGAWLGLAAAAFWAVSIWPVSISRAHYLMVESYLIVLSCFAFFYKALRSKSPVYFALAGLFWGFSFSVYTGVQVMAAIIPWLCFLVWLLRPQRRASFMAALPALAAGFVIGVTPLLLWASQDPSKAFQEYFASLYGAHTAGDVGGNHAFFSTMDAVIGRALGTFGKTVSLFALNGIQFNPWYFPPSFPLFHPAMFFLFMVGASIALSRFRNPLYAFLLYWWFAGLLPAMVADPTHMPNDRRAMMAMPPTLLMASLGLLGCLDFFTRPFKGRLRAAILLLAGLGFFAWFGKASWHDYFERNQRDPELLKWDEEPTARLARAVFEENKKGPVTVVTSQFMRDAWCEGMVDNPYNSGFWVLNPGVQSKYLGMGREYFENEGVLGQLRWAMQTPGSNGQKADVLVALTPFHYYLEPWLQKLGAVRVAELPRIRLREEPEGTAGSFMRLLRMKGLKAADLDKAREAGLYRFSAEELSMPERASLLVPSGQVWRSELIKVVEDYEAHPRDWKPLHKVEFKLSDPWFWTLLGSLPGGIGFPMRLKCAMEVEIPKDGDYAFGASSTPSIWVKLDGKQVFRHLQGQECDETMREGRLGDPVPLKAGKHRLELEQAWLSPHGNFQHSLRLVWRAPAGELETLPLSSIRPL